MARERSAATEVRRLRWVLRYIYADLDCARKALRNGDASKLAISAERVTLEIERSLAPRRRKVKR